MKKLSKLLVFAIEFVFGAIIVYSIGYVLYAAYKAQIHKWIDDVQYYMSNNSVEIGIALMSIGAVLVLNHIYTKISARLRRKQKCEQAKMYFKKRLIQQAKQEPDPKNIQIPAPKPKADGWSQFIDASRKGFL